jgi:uncharacterized protein YecE (DUF72 family)
MSKSADVRIGISGWRYAGWRGDFYPEGLPQRAELEYASRKLNSIEINGTFYSLQNPALFRRWRDAAPEGFVFAVKGSRYITHMLRLRDAGKALNRFWASGVRLLGPKLGPILWQLPPTLKYDRALLESFLDALPEDLRHAVEPRHASFETPEFLELLRARNVSVVVADTAGKWPLIKEATADFVYARLHGDEELYTSGYTPQALRRWAAFFRRRLSEGRDVYVYFDNDKKVRAPYDAMALAALLTGRSPSVKMRESSSAAMLVAGSRGERHHGRSAHRTTDEGDGRRGAAPAGRPLRRRGRGRAQDAGRRFRRALRPGQRPGGPGRGGRREGRHDRPAAGRP